jgi:acyl carrier protein
MQFDDLAAAFSEASGVDRSTLAPETKIDDAALDSLEFIAVMQQIEARFGVQFEIEELTSLETLQQLYDKINAALVTPLNVTEISS